MDGYRIPDAGVRITVLGNANTSFADGFFCGFKPDQQIITTEKKKIRAAALPDYFGMRGFAMSGQPFQVDKIFSAGQKKESRKNQHDDRRRDSIDGTHVFNSSGCVSNLSFIGDWRRHFRSIHMHGMVAWQSVGKGLSGATGEVNPMAVTVKGIDAGAGIRLGH